MQGVWPVVACVLFVFAHGSVESGDTTTTTTTQSDSAHHVGSSGLAWDKHDFDVANNKGGDVKVEVNLAAPMTATAPEDEPEDITDLLRVMAPEDPVNPLDLMSMMRDLMATMKPEDPPEINITQIVSEFKQTLPQPAPQPALNISALLDSIVSAIKSTDPPQIHMPPAQPGPNVEAIVNALQPPAPPPAQPFDIGSFMREMRETMAANKPPPVPPPGMDPQLLDLLRQTMNDMRDMKKELQAARAASTPPPPLPPPPPPSPSSQPNPVALPPIFVPPAPPAAGGAIPTHDSVRDMIMDALSQIKPPTIPPMPNMQDDELAKLRKLLEDQAKQITKPIILPPPVVPMGDAASGMTTAPPPPPPPTDNADFRQQLRSMVAGMIPKPQRISAPPSINTTSESVTAPCCPPPTPEDRRTEVERCPLVNGISRPRCKRNLPPSVVPIKCKRAPCTNVDADGDVNLDPSNADVISQMPAEAFNPKKLLLALCPNGHCPGQDSQRTRKLSTIQAQSQSI